MTLTLTCTAFPSGWITIRSTPLSLFSFSIEVQVGGGLPGLMDGDDVGLAYIDDARRGDIDASGYSSDG